jgi:SP family general alpha glucoside:H+ symporter-like MFS transporter
MAARLLSHSWADVSSIPPRTCGDNSNLMASCYAIITEVSATRLRSKSVCLSRIAYYIAQIVCNVVNPYMLNPTAGDWKGKTGFFWGGCALVFFVWTFFRLPETKGRNFEELDILFAKRVPARDFKKYEVDAYAQDESLKVLN